MQQCHLYLLHLQFNDQPETFMIIYNNNFVSVIIHYMVLNFSIITTLEKQLFLIIGGGGSISNVPGPGPKEFKGA